MRIRSPKDFWSGVMFVGFGLFIALWSLTHYRVGTPLEIGPGFLPAGLGGLVALVGLVVLVRSLYLSGERVPAFHWRPFVLVPGAAAIYGYLLNPLGLVLTTIAIVVLAGAGGREFRWKESILLGVALAVFSIVVFVKGLSLPVPLWPALGLG